MKKLLIVLILLMLTACQVKDDSVESTPVVKENNYVEYMGQYRLKRIEWEKLERVEVYYD
jgi:hypothetical protein